MTRAERRAHFAAILEGVCRLPGRLSPAERRAAAEGASLPAALAALAARIRAGAAAVTDDDVAAARRAGYDDDALFEVTVATALGESRRRLDAALRALGRGA